MHMRTMMMHTKALKFLSHYSSLRRMKTRMKTEHWEEAKKQLSKNHAAAEVTGHGEDAIGSLDFGACLAQAEAELAWFQYRLRWALSKYSDEM